MKIILTIVNHPKDHRSCLMGVDFKTNDADSVRTNNAGISIYNQIKKMIDDCEHRSAVAV